MKGDRKTEKEKVRGPKCELKPTFTLGRGRSDDGGSYSTGMSEYRKAKKRVDVSVGESVRIIRELQELSQNQLAELTGIPQSTISAIERDRVNLGVERAKALARALKVHPAVLVFPNWDVERDSAA
jgi:DNA-binding XRE family transcriptional regulator